MRQAAVITLFVVAAQIAVAGFYLEVNAGDPARADLFTDQFGVVFVGSVGGTIDMYPPPDGFQLLIWNPPPDPFVSFYTVSVMPEPGEPLPPVGPVAYFTTTHHNVDVYLMDSDTLAVLGNVRIPEPAGMLLLGVGGLMLRRRMSCKS